MLTRWGRELDPAAPWPEYPRPQLVRPDWVNLNGRWDYAIRDSAEQPRSWDGQIVVPFAPESALSGVGRQLQPGQWLHYRRRFAPPAPPAGGRVLLHFGAVDQQATVRVDGVEVGRHTGGYLPFTLDVTEALRPDPDSAELVVSVQDWSETRPHARGKQRLDRGTIWYTAQSGIWQTVWAEAVPATYITGLQIVPHLDQGRFTVTATTSDGVAHTREHLPAEPRRWTPDDPALHRFTVAVGDDVVTTYGALRTVGVGTAADGTRRLLLNGEPFQHVGVLDQGYWPDGLLTPPSDEAVVYDLETVKSLGFTVVRKHVKVEPLRWYHHCDRIGLLVWQDMVNGGGRYRSLVTQLPARRWVPVPDRLHRVYQRGDAAARAEFRDEVRRTVALLRNSPSVAVWVPFNEGWGQFDSRAVAAEVARLDPTRVVCATSGWIDHGAGDVRAFHRYLRPWRMPRRRERRAVALTEYGGYGLRVPGHVWSERIHGYRRYRTPAELAVAFTRLHADELAPTVPQGLAATVYTQLTDVEDELNGLLTWDREVLKIPAEAVRAALDRLRRPG